MLKSFLFVDVPSCSQDKFLQQSILLIKYVFTASPILVLVTFRVFIRLFISQVSSYRSWLESLYNSHNTQKITFRIEDDADANSPWMDGERGVTKTWAKSFGCPRTSISAHSLAMTGL